MGVKIPSDERAAFTAVPNSVVILRDSTKNSPAEAHLFFPFLLIALQRSGNALLFFSFELRLRDPWDMRR